MMRVCYVLLSFPTDWLNAITAVTAAVLCRCQALHTSYLRAVHAQSDTWTHWAVVAERLSELIGIDAQQVVASCVPYAILPLAAAEDKDGLHRLAWAVGSGARQVMEAHGHMAIAKRLYAGTAPWCTSSS